MEPSLPLPLPPEPPRTGRPFATIKALLRARLTAGIITILPVLVTLWIVRLVFSLIRDSSQWLVEAFLLSAAGRPLLERWKFDFARWDAIERNNAALGQTPDGSAFIALLPQHVQWGVPICSVLLTVFVVYIIGLLTANLFGRRIIEAVELLVDRVPLVKTVYRGIKQILGSLSGTQATSFQRAALIPFPDARLRAVGFVTSTFKDSVTGEELATVFIPTTPNPTTGFLQVLKRADLTEVNWSTEESVRMIMSAGILPPEHITMVQTKDLDKHAPTSGGPDATAPFQPPEGPVVAEQP